MNVNLTACSYYPTFLKQTNSLKPNAEHSSALESASYIGGWNGYRDISGSRATDPQNDHQRGPLSPSLIQTRADETSGLNKSATEAR